MDEKTNQRKDWWQDQSGKMIRVIRGPDRWSVILGLFGNIGDERPAVDIILEQYVSGGVVSVRVSAVELDSIGGKDSLILLGTLAERRSQHVRVRMVLDVDTRTGTFMIIGQDCG
jgi:hypothetical protein